MIEIDGSYGEGGGQILRTSISLSAITGKAVQIRNIRANRDKPGLRPQHMVAVRVLADLFQAKVENLRLGAEWIRFSPEPDKFDGSITRVDIGTAGSITMVLQTVIPSVALAGKSLNIRIIGGTDVRMSPTTDYIRYILHAAYQRLGIEFNIEVLKRGYYPKGGGIIDAKVNACSRPGSLDMLNSRRIDPKITSVCCCLPKEVSERQISSAILKLEKNEVRCNNYSSSFESSASPGSSILVYSESNFGPYIGGDSIGERGKRSEKIGEEASARFLDNYQADVPIDFFLADMLLVPLSLAQGKSRYRVGKVTEHLKTNLRIVSQIAACKYHILPAEKSHIITIEGAGR
jgi:RNA 3'-terminal phosphate cyclase (ATP)